MSGEAEATAPAEPDRYVEQKIEQIVYRERVTQLPARDSAEMRVIAVSMVSSGFGWARKGATNYEAANELLAYIFDGTLPEKPEAES